MAIEPGVATTPLGWRADIDSDPAMLSGTPVLRGTRMSVAHVLAMLTEEISKAEILANDRCLQRERLIWVSFSLP